MDLKEFTTQTLVQIAEGANEANRQLEHIGGFVPNAGILNCKKYMESGVENVVDVEFDVAITAMESEGRGGGAGIKVVSALHLGGNMESKVENQTVSRVKYTLPLVLKKNEESNGTPEDAYFGYGR